MADDQKVPDEEIEVLQELSTREGPVKSEDVGDYSGELLEALDKRGLIIKELTSVGKGCLTKKGKELLHGLNNPDELPG